MNIPDLMSTLKGTPMNIPDLMPILSAGAHPSPESGACFMEMASYLAGEVWSDSPACTHPVLASMARTVNDRLPDSERGALLDLLPRFMGTTEGRDRRTSVALAVWCAEQVAHLAGSAEPQAREAIRVTRAWLAGEAVSVQCDVAASRAYSAAAYASSTGNSVAFDAAYVAFDAAYAAHAAHAAHAAAGCYSANNAVHAAHAAAAAAADAALPLVDLMTGLADEYDRITGRGQVDPLGAGDVRRLAALTN